MTKPVTVQKCFGEMLQAVFLPAELSPGLAALTVGCQSGNLSSMSRVQLLLLKRVEPEDEAPSPLQDWSGFRMQYDAGLTSSGIPTMQQKMWSSMYACAVFLLKKSLVEDSAKLTAFQKPDGKEVKRGSSQLEVKLDSTLHNDIEMRCFSQHLATTFSDLFVVNFKLGIVTIAFFGCN